MTYKALLSKLAIALFAISFVVACSDDDNGQDNTTPTSTDNTEDSNSSFSTNTTDSTFTNAVTIVYSTSGAVVTNPYSSQGVTVSVSDNDVSVTSTTSTAINYVLSGSSSDGVLSINSSNPFGIVLNGVSLINSDGPAIFISSSSDASIKTVGTTNNRLIDNSSYASTFSAAKGTIHSAGNITLTGSGNLTIKGYARHGIASSAQVSVSGGNTTIASAAKDGVHAVNFTQTGGTLTITPTGDGIEAEDGSLNISGGTLNVTSSVADTKGLKADNSINITGGEIVLTASGDQTKAIKADNVTISDGTLTINTTGDVVLESSGSGYDPSYCTAIKTDNAFLMSGGTLTVNSSGKGGKGVSTDGNFTITGGTISITTTGNGSTYTDSDGATDSYNATGISVDGNAYLYGGTITVSSSGSAGKGISVDGELIAGESTSATGPSITVTTSGDRFYVSGSGSNIDYANPKAIKSDGNLTVNSGTIKITTTSTQEGGEGLESKATMTINGGTIEAITANDDALNASTAIVINGGYIYAYGAQNDGIDSNGTLSINGGVVIASGAAQPEAGFDCDNSTFAINGGVVIGTGGDSSTPTSSASSQYSVLYNGSGTANNIFRVETSSGTEVLTYKLPRTHSSMKVLFSTPALASGSSYNIYIGGSISGGTNFNGYYTGATYTKPSSASNSFTISSKVTSIGTSSSSGGMGGRGGR